MHILAYFIFLVQTYGTTVLHTVTFRLTAVAITVKY